MRISDWSSDVCSSDLIARACDKIIEKSRKIAAHLMEASVEDVEFDNGKFRVASTDKEKSIAEIAFTAYVPHNYPADLEPGLDETAFYDPLNFTYPAGVHKNGRPSSRERVGSHL